MVDENGQMKLDTLQNSVSVDHGAKARRGRTFDHLRPAVSLH